MNKKKPFRDDLPYENRSCLINATSVPNGQGKNDQLTISYITDNPVIAHSIPPFSPCGRGTGRCSCPLRVSVSLHSIKGYRLYFLVPLGNLHPEASLLISLSLIHKNPTIYRHNESHIPLFLKHHQRYKILFCFSHQCEHSNTPKDYPLMVRASLCIDTRFGQYPIIAD